MNYGPYEFTICLFLVLVALQFMLPRLGDFSFGILKLKTVNSIDQAWQQDTAQKDLCHQQITLVDYESRRKMRDAYRKVVELGIKKYPKAVNAILQGKTVIATTVCDNHITYDLKKNTKGFIARKIDDCIMEQYREITPLEREAIIWCTIQWVKVILDIQRLAIEQKLEFYRQAAAKYKNKVFQQTVKERIEKNEEYLKCIAEVDPDGDSATWYDEIMSKTIKPSSNAAGRSVTDSEINAVLCEIDAK